MKKKLKEIIDQALGEASVIFMSQEIKGTDIIMPTEELLDISDKAYKEIVELFELEETVLSDKFTLKR